MSSRPDAHLSIVPAVRTTCHTVRTFQQPVQTTLSIRPSFRFSFQNQIWEDCCNSPDDVDSRLHALLLKGKFAIQTQPSGRRSTMVWTCVQQIWKLRAADYPSRRPSPMVRTREALVRKLLAADVKLFRRQCLTVRTRFSNRKDFQRKSQNFGRTVVPSDGP
jgi:hypothetical protein